MRKRPIKRLKLEKNTVIRMLPQQLERAVGLGGYIDPSGGGSGYSCDYSQCDWCSIYSGCPPCPTP